MKPAYACMESCIGGVARTVVLVKYSDKKGNNSFKNVPIKLP